jgi:hypothetical protein
MLFGPLPYKGEHEHVVIDAEVNIVCEALTSGYNVIVDDMNLSSDSATRWKRIADSVMGCDLSDIHFNTPVPECVLRDSHRRPHKKVGAGPIWNSALRYGQVKFDKPSYVICDIDDTLADPEHRLLYIINEERVEQWDEFYMHIIWDKPIWPVIEWVRALHASGIGIILVSGRPDRLEEEDSEGNHFQVYEVTQKWLAMFGVPYDFMFTRHGGDHRPDDRVKKNILDWLPLRKDQIEFVIDDRPRVIRMWRENGLRVFPVNTWRGEF